MTDRAPAQPLRPTILLLAMVGLLGVAGWWIFHTRAWFGQRDWVEVTAAVEAVEYHRGIRDRLNHRCPTGDGDGPRELHITYRYELDGKAFSNDAYSHVHRSELYCDEESTRARMAELQEQGTLPVWVDPGAPHQAVIRRESGSEIITVFLLLFFAEVVLIVFWRRQRQRWKRYEDEMRAYTEG